MRPAASAHAVASTVWPFGEEDLLGPAEVLDRLGRAVARGEHLGHRHVGVGLQHDEVGRAGSLEGLGREALGGLAVARRRERPRARDAPAHLRLGVVAGRQLRDRRRELQRLGRPAHAREHVREVDLDQGSVRRVVGGAEHLARPAQGAFGRLEVAARVGDDRADRLGGRHVDVQAEVVQLGHGRVGQGARLVEAPDMRQHLGLTEPHAGRGTAAERRAVADRPHLGERLRQRHRATQQGVDDVVHRAAHEPHVARGDRVLERLAGRPLERARVADDPGDGGELVLALGDSLDVAQRPQRVGLRAQL